MLRAVSRGRCVVGPMLAPFMQMKKLRLSVGGLPCSGTRRGAVRGGAGLTETLPPDGLYGPRRWGGGCGDSRQRGQREQTQTEKWGDIMAVSCEGG